VLDEHAPAGVSVPAAIGAGAIMLWRTHVDQMPDEGNAMTAVALADVHAAADRGEWFAVDACARRVRCGCQHVR
jgi:hypothetical protein